jgi:hypothetical protein
MWSPLLGRAGREIRLWRVGKARKRNSASPIYESEATTRQTQLSSGNRPKGPPHGGPFFMAAAQVVASDHPSSVGARRSHTNER